MYTLDTRAATEQEWLVRCCLLVSGLRHRFRRREAAREGVRVPVRKQILPGRPASPSKYALVCLSSLILEECWHFVCFEGVPSTERFWVVLQGRRGGGVELPVPRDELRC